MTTRYALADDELALIKPHLESDIRFCLPADIGDGGYARGWVVATSGRLLLIRNRAIVELAGSQYLDIDRLGAADAVRLTGSGRLELEVDGQTMVVAEYTLAHAAGFALLARSIERAHEVGDIAEPALTAAHEEWEQHERVARSGYWNNHEQGVAYKASRAFVRLVGHMRPFLGSYIVLALLFLLGAALGLGGPYFTQLLVDDFLVPRRRDVLMVVLLVSGMGVCGVAAIGLEIVRNRITARVGAGLAQSLRQTVFVKLQALSLSYIKDQRVGDLMNRVAGDTMRIQRALQTIVANGINHLFVLLAISALLLVTDWRIALVIILPAPLLLFLARSFWRQLHHQYRRQWRFMDRLYSILQDTLSAIRVVKAYGTEQRESVKFNEGAERFRAMSVRNERLFGTLQPMMTLVMAISSFLVYYFGGRLVLGGEVELGMLVRYAQYAGLLHGPLMWLAGMPHQFIQAMTSAERIFEVIDENPAIVESERPLSIDVRGAVEFTEVTFGYEPHAPVLRSVSLSVQPGEMIGLVGHSGAGKSTVINLLLRLFDTEDGSITIDGVDLRDHALANLRRQMGVVMQQTFLFAGSVQANIAYSKPAASREEVIRAARVAHAHEFIVNFADGYDTRVGERGQRLSGGERQRIAIARAILHDPKILILDEATSAVDTETEEKIQAALARLVEGRTTFAIAHRLSTLRNADRLVVLDHGQIAEVGSHDELMDRRGIYYGLVNAQRQMIRRRGS